MKDFTIEIESPPLTQEQLGDLRCSAIEQKQSAIRNKQRLKWASSLLFIVFLIGDFTLYSAGIISSDNAAFFAVVGAAVAGIVVGAAVGVVAVGVGVFVGVFVGVVGSVVVVAGVVVGVAVSAGLIYLFEKLNHQINQSEAQLSGLIELNADEHPDLCIAYDALYTQNKTIGSFQSQLAKQGRKPVIAEYEAAKTWVEGSEKRAQEKEKRAQEKEKQEAAIEACQRMSAIG